MPGRIKSEIALSFHSARLQLQTVHMRPFYILSIGKKETSFVIFSSGNNTNLLFIFRVWHLTIVAWNVSSKKKMGNSLSCKEKKWLSLPPGLPIGPAIRSLVGRWYRGGTRFSRPAFSSETLAFNTYFFSRRKITQINGNFGFLNFGEFFAAILSAEKLSKKFWAKLTTISWFVIHQRKKPGFFSIHLVGRGRWQ